MNILFLVLNKTEFLDDILDNFMDIGIKGATIIDSQGMGTALNICGGETPIFSGLKTLIDGSKPYNKTIFTVIEGEELLDKAVKSIRKILDDFNEPGIGFMFTLPVNNMYTSKSIY